MRPSPRRVRLKLMDNTEERVHQGRQGGVLTFLLTCGRSGMDRGDVCASDRKTLFSTELALRFRAINCV